MLTQIKILAKLELCNLYGLNVFRFSKDKKAKRRTMVLMAAWVVVIAMLMFYVGILSWGLVKLGLEKVIPAYLIMIASLIIFFFGIFKAGNVIFRKNGYDMMCSLPVSQTAVVVSRFLRMYVENLIAALAALLPGYAVYSWFVRPGASFYLSALLGLVAVPLLPVTAAVVIGAVITGISSRMKHKSIAASLLSILVVLAVMFGAGGLSEAETNITPEMLRGLSGILLEFCGKLYPPAVWLGTAIVSGNILKSLLYTGLFLVIFAAAVAAVSVSFHSVCRMLYGTFAKHNYQMEELRRDSVLIALCKREFKRYFASSIYVTNTIIGPILGVVFAGAMLFMDLDQIMGSLSVFIDVQDMIPFILAGVFSMMPVTSVSISMEGKNWWIVKTLPLTTKNILDAKILMNLFLTLPFYLAAEVLLAAALRPKLLDMLWLVLIPALMIVFFCVYGITVNLCFPVLNWESETSVVKQSASSAIGGLGGMVLAIVCAVVIITVPDQYENPAKAVLCVLLSAGTLLLYQKNNRTDLRKYE